MSQDRELAANVHPLLAAALIVLVLGIFASRYEFDRLSLAQPFPTHITTFIENQLSIVADNRIFHGNQQGEMKTTLLEPLGVQEQIGAIGRFANGDWLLRTGYRDNSLLQNLAIYLRLRTPTAKHDHSNGVLMRCSEANASCSVFNGSLPTFDRTFGLAIAADDTVYIADTSEHRLLKIDPSGGDVHESKAGFEFPNQLVFVGKDLWLANTNQHEIVRINTSADGFGRKLETIDLLTAGAPREFKWPTSLARVADGWWVLGKGNNLVGGAILRFDAAWNFRDTIALPDKTDPAFVHAFGEHIHITDMEHRRVLRFNQAGTPQPDLDWPALTQMLQQAREQAAHYRRLSQLCLAAFVGVLLGGVLLIRLQARELHPGDPASRLVTLDDPIITWIDITPGIKNQFRFTLVAVLLVTVFFVGSAFMPSNRDPTRLLSLAAWPVSMMALMLLFWRRTIKQRIGIKGDTLILVSANGYATGSAQQILYTPQHLLIGDIAVTLGKSNKPLFPHEALVQNVFPLLTQARSISASAMQMQLIRTASPHTALLWVALIAVPAMLLLTKH